MKMIKTHFFDEKQQKKKKKKKKCQKEHANIK